ncbi:TonB-dependent receptor [Candidatus Koribacter versatilis Ellin345]|uniref:TonB-dependent receptor n=1 Tax=Koribacter versatilis (strain Ellin345) TaxID=204669 RepID=Q1ITY2_KORVE|nr:TonB-dependent receptor [Candidatus Koribacter versatilis]ABF39668.1 TonB-dependent receptor [Candidatus Koribacter versatilis Ellin345]
MKVGLKSFGRFSLAVFVFLATMSLFAQKDAGTIAGVVRDPSGAVVAGAQVLVRDIDRGGESKLTTNANGEYVASPLRIGHYTVEVNHPGFRGVKAGPIELQVQQRAVLDLQLQVGDVTEKVEVVAAAPRLETETSELGQVVSQRQVSQLPLNGRNFAQLAQLSAGVAPSEPGSRDEGGYGFSSNGARSLQNNFLLDGVDNNSNLPDLLNETNFVIQPPIDALQEFKVQTSAYSAEFGRGNGAIINAVIKSGTNQFHGGAWEFFRNEALDARYYYDTDRQPYKQNQYGVMLGGPIIKDRTFFFADFEGLRLNQAQPQTALVPTQDMRNGDFSSFLDTSTQVYGTNAAGNLAPILDCNGMPTYSGEIFNTRLTQAYAGNPTGICGMPFGYSNGLPVNIMPGGVIDPLAQRLSALYPLPNSNNNAGFNYIADPVQTTHRANFDVRIDHKFSERNNIFGRFSYEDQPSFFPPTFSTGGDGGGFFSGIEDNAYKSVAISDIHTFSPTFINEFRLGYNRINSHRFQQNYNVDVSGAIGFPGVPFTPINGGLPQLTFSDVSTLGSPTFLPSVELQNTYVLDENVTWVKGRHTWKFGTEIRKEEFTINQPAESRGTLNFGNDFTSNPGAQDAQDLSGNALGSGSGYASFLLGATDGGGINNIHNVDYHRPIYSFFAQDDWKVNGRLTVNLGLRYELFTTVKSRHNEQGTFDLATATLILPKGQTAQLTPYLSTIIPVSATGSEGLIKPDLNNFAPRIGFAFLVDQNLVLRAGYGIFYGGQENGPYSNPSPGFNPPYFVTQSFNTPCGLASLNPNLAGSGQYCGIDGLEFLQNGFPASALTDPNTPILYSVDPALRTPYMQNWHIGFQQQIGANTVFELGYAGSRGLKLFTFLNGNQATPTADPNSPFADRRPIPQIDSSVQWFRSGGQSNYNSLQASLERHFANGFTYHINYTWGHSLDTASNANLGAQNGGDFRDMRFPNAEYGNSDFDVRHHAVFSALYDLPFGIGRKYATDISKPLDYVIGGWQVGGIASFSTGNWYTVTSNAGVSNADGGGNVGSSDRPDQIGNPNAAPCQPGTWFNTCAFTVATPGTFGDVGRNTIQGPGYEIVDFSLYKDFAVTERSHFEFRAEMFNSLNHYNPLFAKSGPQNGNNATVYDPSNPGLFGVITAARSPRQIQLALKFLF